MGDSPMPTELAVAAAMVIATVLIHGWGLSGLDRLLAGMVARARAAHRPLQLHSLGAMITMALGLFALHGAEIWLYAVLYFVLGAIEDIRAAVYFSTATYGAIGFSDRELAEDWRLVAGIEGINGVLLLGWSTAFFVTVMTRLQARE